MYTLSDINVASDLNALMLSITARRSDGEFIRLNAPFGDRDSLAQAHNLVRTLAFTLETQDLSVLEKEKIS